MLSKRQELNSISTPENYDNKTNILCWKLNIVDYLYCLTKGLTVIAMLTSQNMLDLITSPF